ncbi:MAG: Eco57I restriction-modification methylase domain-containing protein [Paludibacteraceae bacterium]|nr:Eco57I restriction-modification methylase domain-containing protein [Paludibacteraceae bacterium]
MALFQKNVLARYISAMDAQQIDAAYTQFVAYFHNPERQQNILTSKEEQFQEGFLRELFVKILGYTLNPDPDYNLITEKKDINDSKKADGAILLNNEVIGIIELKDHKTPDLSKVERQAFGYKNQHPQAKYVVISNFQKLRFYIDNAVEHVEWNLFTLTREEFAELWLCLQYDNLSRHLPATVKSESLSREEQITNQLYKDYIDFKRVLFADILRRNTTEEGEHSTAEWKILLFKKTQKLLDRLLFIFFAEDRDLLPPNSMREIIKQWRQLVEELDEDVRLYSRIKKYFGYMNEGHKGKKYDIFAYNGGLFKPDEVLDNLDIDDNLLAEHTLRLSEYDYASEVDVNILGHIFENSLSEIEEVTAQLQNGEAPTVSKRKKDGVFYTPQYITRYIVDNTLGKLCREKREAIGLVEEDYYDAQTRQMKTKQRMMDLLKEYREWLLSLTICDPACGSGAFLNAALQFLIDEHKSLDKMEAALTNSDIEFPNIENSILENNLYGVDINEESVEIARLALWLRTAKPFRKLTTLNGNIKCGNSLISDPAIAGDKAFDWQKEFPQVFEKGGFDIVIGNPPYVQLQNLGEMSDKYAQCGYEVFNKSADLYCLFTERGYNLLKEGGVQSFIMPNKWMLVAYGKELRKFLAKTNLCQILNFGDVQFFEDAATIVCIFVTQKSAKGDFVQALSLNNKTYHGDFDNEIKAAIDTYPASTFGEDEWTIQPRAHMDILQKMKAHKALKDLPITINYGVKTGYNEAFFIDTETKDKLISSDKKSEEIIKPLLRGRDITAWGSFSGMQFLINPHNGVPRLNVAPIDIEQYPIIKSHLDVFYDKLSQRGDKGVTPYNLRNCDYLYEFSKPKIIYPNMTSVFPFTYDESGCFGNDKTFILTAEDDSMNLKYLTCIFNSKLCKLWIWYNCPELLGGTREIRKVYFENFPVPACDDQQPFIDLADRMLSLNKDLQQKRARFLRRMSDNFAELKVTATLENFDTLTFADFVKELGKQKIRLTLVQQDEWEEYFNQYATECQTLTQTIQATDTQIDELVYSLYNLTDSEKDLLRKTTN